MTQNFKAVRVTDEFETCLCCGREGLKRVVMLLPLDVDGNPDGCPVPFGTTCAARALGYSRPTSAATKRRVEDEATAAMKAAKLDRMREIVAAAVVEPQGFSFNRFNVPRFTALVNGEPVHIDGHHVTNPGTCTPESLAWSAVNQYGARKVEAA